MSSDFKFQAPLAKLKTEGCSWPLTTSWSPSRDRSAWARRLPKVLPSPWLSKA